MAGFEAVTIEAVGRPRTKGSMKPVHRKLAPGRCAVSLAESGEYSVAWKRTMIAAVKASGVPLERYEGAVNVHCEFRFERLIAADWELPWPTRLSGAWAHGDVDKLVRNVYDALTQSGLILDDSLIVGGLARKRWAGPNENPGVTIRVTPLTRLTSLLAGEQGVGVPAVGVEGSDG